MKKETEGMQAIGIEELKRRLRKGPVKFSFEKRDGSLREAYGTLDLNMVPDSDRPKGDRPGNAAVSFYDLAAKGWRAVAQGSPVWA